MSNRKTILFIEFYPASGSSTGLLAEIKYIRRHHDDEFECIVVASPNSIFEEASKKIGFKLYTASAVELVELYTRPLYTLKNYVEALFTVLLVAARHNPSIIHCYHYSWSIYANPVGFLLGKPVIIHLKDVWLLKPKIARILMKFNPRARYIAVSNFVKRTFVNKYNLNKAQTIMIYDAVDEQVFFRASKAKIVKKHKQRRKRLVYMSRVDVERDVEIFVDTAWHLLKKYPDLKFLHFGYHPVYSNQEYFNDLMKRVKALGIAGNFTFKKYLENPTLVAKVLRDSYLTIIPARRFALPNAAIESMMCGTPVIAYEVGGNPEIIKDYSIGDLIPVNNSFFYAQAVKKYLKGEKDYTKTALFASSFVHDKFSTRVQFKKLIRRYNGMLAKQ